MAGRLAGKVALITGAARGQGAAEAELFCAEGAKVLLTDVRDAEGEAVAERLRAAGLDALYRRLDVAEPSEWDQAVRLAEDALGPLDVLVNNAGIVTLEGVADLPEEEWRQAIAVNQTGVALGMKAAARAMRDHDGGSMVNVASIYGVNGVPGYFAYQATKGAVVQMTRSGAVDLAGDRIRVNCILPGLILTEMNESEPEEVLARDIERTPLGRGGEPGEVANGALFLVSDEASYVTGAVLPIDGGYTAQ